MLKYLVILLLTVSAPVVAQQGGDNGGQGGDNGGQGGDSGGQGGEGGQSGDNGGTSPSVNTGSQVGTATLRGSDGTSVAALSRTTTRRVARAIRRDFQRCNVLPAEYRFDCYRQSYVNASAQIAGNRAYRPAQQALKKVENRLARTVRAQADRAKPPLKKGNRQYRAIKTSAVPRAKRDLDRALDQAETILLRSSGAAQPHFSEIAAAVQSNKLLLRSALLLRPRGPRRNA